MSFMQIYTREGGWYLVDTVDAGTCIIPDDVCGSIGLKIGETIDDDDARWDDAWAALSDYCEGRRAQSIEYVERWGAHYSAAGYMDQTDWTLADSEEKAIAECKELYGDEDDEDDEDSEESGDE